MGAVVTRKRDWSQAFAKIQAEGCCRACKRPPSVLRKLGRRLEIAHTIGREYDRKDGFVDPLSVVPLCGPSTTSATCHGKQHAHTLDLWPLLTIEEREWAIRRVGPGQARRKLSGRVLR